MKFAKNNKSEEKEGNATSHPAAKETKSFFGEKKISEKEALRRKEEARLVEQPIPEDAPPAYDFLEEPTGLSKDSLRKPSID